MVNLTQERAKALPVSSVWTMGPSSKQRRMSELVHFQVKLYPFLFLVRTDSSSLESEAAHRYVSRCVRLSLTQRTQSLEVAVHINAEKINKMLSTILHT